MKKVLGLFLVCFSLISYGQNQLKVIHEISKKAIPNAAVYCDDLLLGKTNENGIFSFKTACKKIEILAPNFEIEEAMVQKSMLIALRPTKEKTGQIERIVLNDKSDPKALAMLEEVNRRYPENTPQSLEAYQFNSYSKISIDVDRDSIKNYQEFIQRRKDSLEHALPKNLSKNEKKKKDSLLGEELISATKESQLFLWEKATQHKFSKQYGEKTTILDNRISGFPNPIYEAIALNISYLNRIPKQIKAENRNLYRYYLQDTIDLEGRKTFVIKFKEITNKQKQNPRKFNGKIYIDAENFALKKLETTSKKINEGNGTILWKPIQNKWFLVSEVLKSKLGSSSFEISSTDSVKGGKTKKNYKKFGNYLYLKNQYYDFKINEPQNASDYKGYTLEIKNSNGNLLSRFRTDSLTTREQATYKKIDTLLRKANIEKQVSLITNLFKGNFRYKSLDIDLTKLIRYNKYEGLRLGAGLKLNENFSTKFSPDLYWGYGFRDHQWKYGAGIDFRTSSQKTAVLRIQYLNDVFVAGRFSDVLWDNFTKFRNLNLDIHNPNFYKTEQISTSFLYDLSNALTVKIALNKEKQRALFEYQYQNWEAIFDNVSTLISFKYAPNDKNVMTPGGKLTYQKNYPQLFLNFEKGIKFLGGQLNYQRIDAMLMHEFSHQLGTTQVKIFGGFSEGSAPIWKNFELAGQINPLATQWNSKINSHSLIGFATMPAGTFYADRFMALHLTQKLPFQFNLGKRSSSLQLEYKTAIGNFKHPEDHHFNFTVLNHQYQEAGMVWNNFLGSNIGLGFSYRLGYYQTSAFQDNFGLQLRFSGWQ